MQTLIWDHLPASLRFGAEKGRNEHPSRFGQALARPGSRPQVNGVGARDSEAGFWPQKHY